MPKGTVYAHLALFAANLMYGINYSVAKDVMPAYVQPFGFILCRVTGAIVFFWLVSAFMKSVKIQRSDYPRLIACGFFGVAANQLMFFEGLNSTTPINASIIMTTNPILVLIASSLLIKERITLKKILGIGIGLTGAVTMLLIRGNNLSELTIGSETLYGDMMVLLNATSYGIYLVIVKPLMHKYPPLQIIKWVFTIGLVFVLPFGLHQASDIDWNTFSAGIWAKFLFVVIGVTCLAYLFNIYALKHVNPTVVSSYIYLQPILASAVAIALRKDHITLIKVLAAMLIMLGVYLVSNYRNDRLKNNS